MAGQILCSCILRRHSLCFVINQTTFTFGNHQLVKEIRVGIVGVGGMGSHHARTLLAGKVPHLRLTAVCDIVPERMEPYPPEIRRFSESDALVNSPDVDAVVVATPHYSHPDIGIAALKAGKHLMVEKPIAVHKADAERLIAAHTDKSLAFGAMFCIRPDAHFQKLRELVKNGELGNLTRINWIVTTWFRSQAYYDSGGWRATWKGEGGGVLLNQCPHNLDLLQWICGMPQSVRAFCHLGKYHKIEVEDEVTAYLEYANGATGVFVTSTGESPGTNRLELCGDRGRVVLEDGKITFNRTEVPISRFLVETDQPMTQPANWKIDVPPLPGGGGLHQAIFKNFADHILNGVPLIAPGEEGIHSVELANAMLLSSLTNTTVKLPLNAARFESLLKTLILRSDSQQALESLESSSGATLNAAGGPAWS